MAGVPEEAVDAVVEDNKLFQGLKLPLEYKVRATIISNFYGRQKCNPVRVITLFKVHREPVM